MRFALQRQADALYAGGDEANNHSQLDCISLVIATSPPAEYHRSGRRVNSQRCWRPRTVPPWLRCCVLALSSVAALSWCYLCCGRIVWVCRAAIYMGIGDSRGSRGSRGSRSAWAVSLACLVSNVTHAAVSVGGTGTTGLRCRADDRDPPSGDDDATMQRCATRREGTSRYIYVIFSNRLLARRATMAALYRRKRTPLASASGHGNSSAL
jgi:hypothetical protein